jgi:Flp pilus assembly protein TadB
MPASSASGPNEPAPLSPRERRVLAAIEDELRSAGTELDLPTTAATSGSVRVWTADNYWAAAAAALLVLLVIAVLPPSWRAVLGLALTFGVIPWLLLRTVARESSG